MPSCNDCNSRDAANLEMSILNNDITLVADILNFNRDITVSAEMVAQLCCSGNIPMLQCVITRSNIDLATLPCNLDVTIANIILAHLGTDAISALYDLDQSCAWWGRALEIRDVMKSRWHTPVYLNRIRDLSAGERAFALYTAIIAGDEFAITQIADTVNMSEILVKGQSPVDTAYSTGNMNIVKLLYRLGAPIDSISARGVQCPLCIQNRCFDCDYLPCTIQLPACGHLLCISCIGDTCKLCSI